MVEVSFDRKSLIIDGRRRLIVSGSIHYFRWPSVEIWRHRLLRLKELGLDAVDVYFYWGYHSPEEGRYDFSGNRDVDLLLDMIEDQGFYLIARPGPYICAEVDGGGFPAWLIRKPGLKLRCRENARFVYDSEYMKYVRQWFEQIVPRIARRQNLILFQIENEYHFLPTPRGLLLAAQKFLQRRLGPNAVFNLQARKPLKRLLLWNQRRAMRRPDHVQSNRYFQELYRMSRELGITVPVFHNDIEGAMQRFGDVDIVGIDDYPVKIFDADWRGKDHLFATLDLVEEGHAAHGKACPVLLSELQGGWFDPWGAKGYAENRRMLGVDSLDITLKTALAQGAAIINLYMAAGGTAWGYTASPDVYTSYDGAAPITEGGRPSARARTWRDFIDFVHRHEQDLLESFPGPPLCELSPRLFCRARHTASGKRFLFFRNCTREPQAARVGDTLVNLTPSSMTVLLVDEAHRLLDRLDPAVDTGSFVFPQAELPKLEHWKFGMIHQPLSPEYDDGDWKKATDAALDLDSLGFHYGFVWYRGRLALPVSRFRLDARHTWAAYLNGRFLMAYDNHHNRLAGGDDMAETVEVEVPREAFQEKNVLCILVESLGHNKGFLEDFRNPRGIVSVDLGGVAVEWRVRGGLVPGESGMTPCVDFQKIELELEQNVSVPHRWPPGLHGVGIYQTSFQLNLPAPDQPPIGLHLPAASGKVNIYLNGWLIGRYWGGVGPQDLFYLPAGILNHHGQNLLALALWRWSDPAMIGRVHLELHP